MYKHPFTESLHRRVAVLITACLLAALYAVLLFMYSDFTVVKASSDSILSIGLLLVLAYYFWFIVDVIHIYQAEFILSIGAIVVWLVGCLIIQLLDFPADETFFSRYIFLLPLRLAIGGILWFGILQWYRTVKLQRWKRERLVTESLQAQQEENVDRIAVKSGSRIHVIPVKDLMYVQACGDYIMLNTPAGEFLKEQTMKSMETSLPENFVRIHRSYIVNVEYIDRVELYGKETYHVQLKNDITLRASVSGYKLLKEQLAL